MKKSVIAALTVVLAAASMQVGAEPNWPTRPIKLVNPYPPGAVSDLLARHISRILEKELGQPVIVENKAGAGSNVGSEAVAKAPGDGYTLLNGSSANTANMSLYSKMQYDTMRDFAPVSLIAEVPNVLVVNSSFPVKSISDLIALAKKDPDKIAYASAGAGSPAHLAAANFARMAGIKMRHIAYKGAGPAVSDVMAGHVPMIFTNYAGVIPGVQSGKLRLIAVGTPARWDLLPNTPTVAESGLPGYTAGAWYGILAPKSTPPEILARLEKALQAVKSPESKEAIRKLGAEAVVSSPQALQARMSDEIKSFGTLIKDSGITVD
ncbi:MULTISPECIES: Bug family tripartite tricarboxylate transporter substrate binding protein [Comamonas]|jgi:hypothetical protein|uniref:Bug family tripartite tricarboxylate transporter substrate binding protein n=1 Tax=Comamonas TaxID=283 RepID=UPI00050E1803|nr:MULTISPECIES: tripartite tricarboxylate transporter substrate binding protein [Comamonas]KGG92580.1 hypothetical protein P369_09315 [Comamonas thiooxydans]KGG98531.1 hypothetical protein P367_12220 [Comamonas thiooxydans]KGH04480.1 hypothetical protein P365_12385 [Comamonas thiooxydans]KGH12990.1 hypothetical protein P368_10570 [Comamonas thiooxydans]TZG06862.1 tripartite tricarboxylate transporter substrate binding protein [Comamonas thiooxydans]